MRPRDFSECNTPSSIDTIERKIHSYSFGRKCMLGPYGGYTQQQTAAGSCVGVIVHCVYAFCLQRIHLIYTCIRRETHWPYIRTRTSIATELLACKRTIISIDKQFFCTVSESQFTFHWVETFFHDST